MMTSVRPFDTLYDVAVFGGGLSGTACALALARAGRRVMLIERRPLLGFEITSAFACDLRWTDSSAVRTVYRALNAARGLRADRVDPVVTEVVLDQLVERHGIALLLYSQPTAVYRSHNSVSAVTVGNKQGEQTLRARVYVDATDQATLWRCAGPGIEQRDGTAQMSMSMHPVTGEMRFPASLDGGPDGVTTLRLVPGVREREVFVEWTVPTSSCAEARLSLDPVVAFVRSHVKQLTDASVLFASVEPLVRGACILPDGEPGVRHDAAKNLFAGGDWASPAGRMDNAARLERGEAAARGVSRVWDGLPQPVTQGGDVTPCMSFGEVRTEVLVVGGGTAGALATIAAARQGAEVNCIEAATFLGGMKTGSGQRYGGHGVPGGLQDEFHARVRQAQPLHDPSARPVHIHFDTGRLVLERMARDAGARIVYGATAIGVEREGDRISGVWAATPHGKRLFRADIVIDSTGDADVARMAGVPYEVGRKVDGIMQPYSQVCYVLQPEGETGCTNHDAGYCDPRDVVDLTRARREGIRQAWQRLAPDGEGRRPLLTICPLLGIRQGPIIAGDARPDFLEGIIPTHFDDCIGYSAAKYDCHSQDFANQQEAPILWVWLLGNRERPQGGQMPFRMMLPERIEALLVACRSASSTQEYNYQFRTMRNQHRLGEAAGIAAALCVQRGITPRWLDVSLVQAHLRESGALGEDVAPGPVVPEREMRELRAMLASNDPKDAVWLLAHGGEQAVALLQDVVASGPPGARFWAAVALAWHRDPAALEELIAAVDARVAERTDYTPHSRNMVPLWQSCIVLLGRIGDPAAMPVIIAVLEDPLSDADALIAAIRALGRIGDKGAVGALQRLLERTDLPRRRLFQQTNQTSKWPASEDGLWQIELAAADVLAGFGRSQSELVAKYLADPRVHVRRYASLVRHRSGGQAECSQQ